MKTDDKAKSKIILGNWESKIFIWYLEITHFIFIDSEFQGSNDITLKSTDQKLCQRSWHGNKVVHTDKIFM